MTVRSSRGSRRTDGGVQIEVVVHGVHGDAEVVVAHVRLQIVVRVLLRIDDGGDTETAAPRIDFAILVRPSLVKGLQRVAQVRPGVVVRDYCSSVVVDPRAPAIGESPARTLEHLDFSAGVSRSVSVDRNHRRSGIISDGGHASVDRVGAGVAHDVSELKLGQKLAADPSECAGGVVEGKATRLRERLCGPIGVSRVRRNALAVVVANRRVRVVVRHVPLAFGGDVIPTVFNVGDVESPLGTDVDGLIIPLDVDADTGTHA